MLSLVDTTQNRCSKGCMLYENYNFYIANLSFALCLKMYVCYCVQSVFFLMLGASKNLVLIQKGFGLIYLFSKALKSLE